jgi:uncharacterized protein Yka (UPF0111/DUF47 family)
MTQRSSIGGAASAFGQSPYQTQTPPAAISQTDAIKPLADCLDSIARRIQKKKFEIPGEYRYIPNLKTNDPRDQDGQYLLKLRLKLLDKAKTSNLDPQMLEQMVNPNDIAERVSNHAEPRRKLLLYTLIGLEWFRNGLALAPLALTWFGIFIAVSAYGSLSKNEQQSQTFLALWQQGFDGHIWGGGVFKLGSLALMDFSILTLLLAVTLVIHWVMNSRVAMRDRLAEEIRRDLSSALAEVSVELMQARSDLAVYQPGTTSPDGTEIMKDIKDLLKQMLDEYTKLAQVRQQREDELKVFQGIDGVADRLEKAAEAIKQANDDLAEKVQTAIGDLSKSLRDDLAPAIKVDLTNAIKSDLTNALKQDLLPELTRLSRLAETITLQQGDLIRINTASIDELQKVTAHLGHSALVLREAIDVIDPSMQRLLVLANDVGNMMKRQQAFLDQMGRESAAQEELTRTMHDMSLRLGNTLQQVLNHAKELERLIKDLLDRM